jgi:dTDP-4-amino-4,6-dideoxygalactose transaminase
MFNRLRNALRFISLEVGPNYQLDDGCIALRDIIFGRFANNKQRRSWCENWFRSHLGRDNDPDWRIHFSTNARHGIYLLLRTLDIPQQSEILIQGFSCIVVPNSAIQAGMIPITCDISSENFNFDLDTIEKNITPQTKVWIIQHNFGMVMDIQRVREIADRHNLIVIEDCAHSLGAQYNNQPVGSFGDAAVYSFGRDKIISTTNGGAVVFAKHQQEWQNRFNAEFIKIPQASTQSTIHNLLYPILVVFFIRPWYRLYLGKIVAVLNLRLRLTGEIYTNGEKKALQFVQPTQYSDILFGLLWNQLQKVERYNSHRKSIAKVYSQAFQLPYQTNNAYLRFPIEISTITKTQKLNINTQRYYEIFKKSRLQGIYLGNWYTQVYVGSSYDDASTPYHYTPESVPTIYRLIQHQVINLPTEIHTSIDEARRICDVVLNAR